MIKIGKYPGIYKIVIKSSGYIYIGSSVNLQRRRSEHFSDLRLKKHPNRFLQRCFNKYGKDALTFTIIELCTSSETIQREQYYIDTLNPKLNMCKIAHSCLGMKMSEENKRKASIRMKNKMKNPKLREHLRKATKKQFEDPKMRERHREAVVASFLENPERNKGFKHTAETKKKISESKKGSPAPNKGAPHSASTKEKMSKKAKERLQIKENNSMYGKHHSEEAKEKIRQKHKTWRETEAGQIHTKRMKENNPNPYCQKSKK